MVTSRILATVGLTAIGAGSAISGIPAYAATDCGDAPSGATVNSYGSICEVVFDVAGDFSFTAPTTVSGAEAIIVGAGGGSTERSGGSVGYAGGGGEVLYIDSVDTSSPITISIGSGGAGGLNSGWDGDDGESSSLGSTEALGGYGGHGGGTAGGSGSGISANDYANGAGAKSDGPSGGHGFLPSDESLTLGSDLFPVLDSDVELGAGGRSAQRDNPLGPGAGAWTYANTAETGADGAVIIRWPSSENLASTGFSSEDLIFMSSGITALGFAAIYSTRRRRAR